MSIRVKIRISSNRPECDSCEIAKAIRFELADQVAEGSIDVDRATEVYCEELLLCSGLRTDVIPFTDTWAGKVWLATLVRELNDPESSSEEVLAKQEDKKFLETLRWNKSICGRASAEAITETVL